MIILKKTGLLFIVFLMLFGCASNTPQTLDKLDNSNKTFSDAKQTRPAYTLEITKPPTPLETKTSNNLLVSYVVDGDTLKLSTGETVRLIGINAPESSENYYSEAKKALAGLVEGKQVTLEKDVSETDQYGRLLRYVYVGNVFVNEYMVENGYARASPYPPDTKHSALFAQAEQQAKNEGIGIWKASRSCDPSYPSVCIPPPPPDLDCSNIPYKRFQVLPPDPHRFDGDNDGIGCET